MTSSSLSASASTTPSPNTYSLFSGYSPIKLDRNNYLLWESMVLPLIKGNHLESHVDGTGVAPPKLIPQGTELRPNPAYEEWFATDCLLLGWLRNTMTQEILLQLLHCKNARDSWIGAKDLTKLSVIVLKGELQRTRKNALKMEEYLGKMQSISNKLNLVGAPIAAEDLIVYTLNGLDNDYNAVVVDLLHQPNLTWVAAQSALLAFESRLELMNQRSWRGGSRGGRRGGGGNHNGGNPPQCQLCGKFGHTASICYHSFDRNFQPNSSTSYMDSGGATHHVASYTDQLENFTCTGARTSSLRTRHFRFLWKTQGGAANGAGSEY